jgi:hypothetical protein
MRDAAWHDGVLLEAISGYRSHDYQLGIFERKLARGQTVEEILTVNAAPGYSEHPFRLRPRHRHARGATGRGIVRATRPRSRGCATTPAAWRSR